MIQNPVFPASDLLQRLVLNNEKWNKSTKFVFQMMLPYPTTYKMHFIFFYFSYYYYNLCKIFKNVTKN